MRKTTVILFACLLFCEHALLAQDTALQPPLKLAQAVDLAETNYPAIRVAQAETEAASENIRLARTTYLPRLDLLFQENRASTNNIFGSVLPQGVVPSISGPVLGTKSLASTFGSVGGALFSWEPFDFGWRKANVGVAEALTKQASVAAEVTRLDAATSAADAFLGFLATQQAVRTAEANVARAQTFTESVRVLVSNGLRAGVDAARAEAELSAAKNLLNRARQTTEISRAALAESLGKPGAFVDADAGPLLRLPDDTSIPALKPQSHPLALLQLAAVETVRARERALDRSYVPRFTFQSAFSARGTGALTNGQFNGGASGLLPNTPNFAIGLAVTFPALDIFTTRARRRVEAGNEAVANARLDQTVQALQGQYARAQALLDGALRIAQETPNQLKAAQQTEMLTLERYKFGLANVTEVAEAQRLLAQAEIDNSVACLNVWRALLVAARLQGDLKPFLQRVRY